MDEDTFQRIYGSALKNITSQQDLDEEAEENRIAQEEAAAELAAIDEGKKKKEQEDKSLLQKAGDLGKSLVGGFQQVGGKVADVALEGGAIVDESANLLKGGTEEEKNQRRQKNLKGTERLRAMLHDMEDVNGNKIGGLQKADAAAQKINSGEAGARDYATLAGESLDVGLGATMFANPTQLLRGGIKTQAGTATAKSGTKLTGKEALKVGAKDSALFGSLDTVQGTASTYGETGDLGQSLKEGGKQGLLSAGTQGVLNTGGYTVNRALSKNGKPAPEAEAPTVQDKVVQVVDKESGKKTFYRIPEDQADDIINGIDNNRDGSAIAGQDIDGTITHVTARTPEDMAKRGFEDGGVYKAPETPQVEESGTEFSKISDDELAEQMERFKAGERTGDTTKDYARYQELKDEAQFRVDQKDQADFEGNGLPNDIEGAEKALEDFDLGNMPDTVYKPREANVKSVAELFADQDIPVEIRNAAQEVMDDQGRVNTMLDGLLNDKKYNQAHRDMDRAYNEKVKELEGMPEPRYVIEKEKLDSQYTEDLAELEMFREKDLPDVEKYNEMQKLLEQREQQVVNDTNLLISENPSEFRTVDEVEAEAQRESLVSNLEQAKRFNEPSQVVSQVATAADPVKAYNRNPQAQEAMKKEVSSQIGDMTKLDAVKKNFQNITGVREAALRVMSPSQVLERMGLRGKELDLHSDILKAESAVNRANKADSEVLQKIADILPNNKQAQSQIIDYLEGNRKTLNIGDETAAADIKAFLDEKRAGLKELGFDTLDDYFPHIFDKNDPDVIRLFESKSKGDISFGNLKSRLSDSKEYSRDIMDVLTTYSSGYNRKVHLEPALKPLGDLQTQVKLSKAEAEWVDGYIKQLSGFDTSKIGSAYNTLMDGALKKAGIDSQVGKNHYTSTLGTQRMISAVATMGLNPGTAVRNMTQMVNTVAEIGPRHSTTGAIDGARLLASKEGRAELQRVGILEGGVSQNYYDVIQKTGVRGKITRGRDASVKGLMSLIHMTDVALRAQAYAGGKSLAAAKGLTGEAAENFAIRKTVDTQFVTSRVDMPLAFSGQGVRSLTQLATFSGKQAGFLKRAGVKMVKGADGQGFQMADAGSVLAAVVTAAVATEALKPLLGFRESEWVPFYDQIAPFAGAITGEEVSGGDSLYRSPLVRLLAGDGKSKMGLIQAIQTGDVNEFWNDNWSQIVPGGTQIKKSKEGFETTTSGESRNSSGKIRFLQDMDQDSRINATVFGQYSTEAGRNWIEEGFPTLSDSQTRRVDEQKTREQKEQYADFFVAKKAAPNRQEAYDEVKAAALTGNSNRAIKVAQEYNESVREAMKEYYAKHDSLPEDLRDELESRVYINATKINNR